ncbi:MAG: dipeptidase PepE [Hymenobacteraceae bacterium]|nr:dipeptidase PepE [Hymenobacteraceae bacterium]
MRQILIISTSTVHGGGYLEYCTDSVQAFFKGCKQILFVPFARPGGISHEEYTQKARGKFAELGIDVKGVHEFADPKKAIEEAEGIFTGGGNTFLLLHDLYKHDLLQVIRDRVAAGMPYMGTSAGSNITGLTIGTTNDMPIIYPPGFDALQLVPFNLNPHYLDPDPNSTHMGETRETRIREFHFLNSQPVIGLREGSWLHVEGDKMTLKGDLPARLFRQNQEAEEFEAGADLSFLLNK